MLPIQITIRAISVSPAAEATIRKRIQKLSQFNKRISRCRVVVELTQKHKHQGKLYNVRVDITVPKKEMAVTYKCHEDVYVAIRDAFNAVERQLEEHSHKRHGKVKTHNDVLHGRIMRMVPEEGYGFIEGVDGNEYYFSVTNVSYPTFKQLAIGDQVEYSAEQLNDGQQAHHVIRT